MYGTFTGAEAGEESVKRTCATWFPAFPSATSRSWMVTAGGGSLRGGLEPAAPRNHFEKTSSTLTIFTFPGLMFSL